jgi:hypothetical protein
MAGLGLEITNGGKKNSRHGNMSLSQLMEKIYDFHQNQDDHILPPMELVIYTNFIDSMKRARTIDFSRNWDDWLTEEEAQEIQERKANEEAERESNSFRIPFWVYDLFHQYLSDMAEYLYLDWRAGTSCSELEDIFSSENNIRNYFERYFIIDI